MIDIATIERETPAAIAAGHRIFQTHKYAGTDAGQVAYLLDILDPPTGAMVLDAGCGIGEVSRLMSEARPDLSFVLMNISSQQLALCPVGEQYLHALDDCQRSMLSTGSMDCAMYSSALCQMNITEALAEAHRVLKHDGVLLINDLVNDGRSADLCKIGVVTMCLGDLMSAITNAGFVLQVLIIPRSDSSHFEALAKEARVNIDGITPVIIRAIARKEFQHGI